jgi:rubredoxin
MHHERMNSTPASEDIVAEAWICTCCGYVYDPAAGDPDNGVAPGTRFEDLPPEWKCPVCKALKDLFERN